MGCYENFQIIKNNAEYYAYIILPDTIAQTNPEQYDFPYGEDVMNEYKSIFNYIDILTSSIEINLSDKEMDDEGTIEIKRKLCELVAAHYNEIYNTDEFVAFEAKGECEETAEGYSITLRSQGFNSANVLVTMVYINTST